MTRTATPSERSVIAQALDVLSCEEVKSDYVIRPLKHGRFRMSGKVAAQLTQRCVATLKPLSQSLEESFDVEFWPAGGLPDPSETEVEALTASEIEPLDHGTIEAGRIIFETLSATLDPYPRTAGAQFDWQDSANADEPSATGPFADLGKLKGNA